MTCEVTCEKRVGTGNDLGDYVIKRETESKRREKAVLYSHKMSDNSRISMKVNNRQRVHC